MAEDVQGILGLLVEYGYWIVFVAGLAEALPLLGWLVPGQAIIILAGALAAGGYLSPVTIVLVAIPAGIVGDAVGYYIGRRYGRTFLEKYGARIRITPRHLARSDALFAKYGPFALVIARFSFLTRAVGPILAGMAKMRARVFWPVNILGAIAWAVAYTILGYFFGVSFLLVQGKVGKILAWTAVALIAIYLFYRVLKRYADQFTRDDLYVVLVAITTGAAFGFIADAIADEGTANPLDARTSGIHALLAPAAPFFRVVDALTSYGVLGAVALIAAIYFFARRRWWDATLVALGMGGVILLVATLRPLFRALLPAGPADSFPSASAAMPLVLAGVVVYLVSMRSQRLRAPVATAVVGALFVSVAQLARIGQGTEATSSVAAGLMLGASWLSITVLVVEFRLKKNPKGHPQDA